MSTPQEIYPHIAHLPEITLKALDAFSQVGQSLERQDLESEITRLNILDHPFYERLDAVKATALPHVYTVVSSRHDKIGYAAYKDGGVPRYVEFDSVQRSIRPSMIAHRLSVTELVEATTANGIKPVVEVAVQEKMTAVLEETEYLNFHGNRSFGSTAVDGPQNLQYDSIEQIVKKGAPMNIIDANNTALSLAMLWAAENRVYQTQGMAKPNVAFLSPIDKINLQTSFYQLARVTDKAARAEGVLGANAQSYMGAYGESELVTSRFLGDWHKYSSAGFGGTAGEFARPTAGVISTATAAAAAAAGRGIGSTITSVQYAFKFANFNGESDVVLGASTPVTPGTQQLTTVLGTIDPSTRWVIVYRNDNASGDYKYVTKIPYYGGANITFVDDGFETLTSAYGTFSYRRVPGTGYVPLVDFTTTKKAQWIPLEKVDLPQVLNKDFVIRHVQSLFSRAPEFNALIINVSQASLV